MNVLGAKTKWALDRNVVRGTPTDHFPPTVASCLQPAACDCGLRPAAWLVACGLRPAACGLWPVACGLLPAARCPLPAARTTAHCPVADDPAALVYALSHRTLKRGSEVVVMDSSPEAGLKSMLMHIYSPVFQWTVLKTNAAFAATQPVARRIGILDIFGFENFSGANGINSHAQLCIKCLPPQR